MIQAGIANWLLVFPPERETTLRRDNFWYEARGVGMRRIRGSCKVMIDDKVAADQRGHGLGVSLEVYSISGVQQKIDPAKRLESEVIQ